jgi:small subunit ribosomal protein S17
MEKTVTVSLSRRMPHAVYSKIVSRTSTVKARDEEGARIGDTVRVMETRPISKTVRWRVIDIVKRAK